MRWIALVAMLVVSGCAGTSSSVRSAYSGGPSDRFAYEIDNYGGMTPEGRTILISRLRQQLASALAVENDQGANRINIRIDYYRMRHGAARALVGVMAGQDHIKSSVTVTARDGTLLGSIVVDSKNPTALFTARGANRGTRRRDRGVCSDGEVARCPASDLSSTAISAPCPD
ncbi:hypothetical protein J2X06_001268 [Lysobacter niastensis]|uniref:DUF4410 domain-containing protein n=1 Tax=Lysobacter niastensis TaxID=380629 RepID=A0ABU1W8Y9_9GAMM|nr:DUF4410 domain-containing protein [Lysobacter niastensis]MDR7134084.1 hypothetical protein [Lysobacter niastensis]